MSTEIQETITRLRELDRTASPAPWHWAEVDFPEDYSTTETVFEMLAGRNAKRIIPPLKDSEIDHDAILLTTARNAIPALLAEIERLAEENQELKQENHLAWSKGHAAGWDCHIVTMQSADLLPKDQKTSPYKEEK